MLNWDGSLECSKLTKDKLDVHNNNREGLNPQLPEFQTMGLLKAYMSACFEFA